ncbi:MAG: T9SS type A sorting domain-containing protein [Bacteroidales bacterium]|jgi:hypothetical protein|nr:T9SS type A sorting domain-containing protein [Bacteroidales bacterium]
MKKIANYNHFKLHVTRYSFKSLNFILLFCFSTFALNAQKVQLPDSSFEGEGWKDKIGLGDPYLEFQTDYFYTLNSLYALPNNPRADLTAFKEKGAQHGDYCIMLKSGQVGVGDGFVFLPGLVGTISEDYVAEFLDPKDKVITTRFWGNDTPHALEGYYKYNPFKNDSAMIQIGFSNFVGDPLIVDERLIISKPASTWTHFSIPVPEQFRNQYFDEIQVLFIASAAVNFEDMMECKGQRGATLWIDNISLNYDLGIKQNLLSTLKANAFPNPATAEVLNIELNEEFIGVIWVYDLNGRKILEHNISGTQSQLNISTLTSGNYLYKLMNENTIFAQGKFVVAK